MAERENHRGANENNINVESAWRGSISMQCVNGMWLKTINRSGVNSNESGREIHCQ